MKLALVFLTIALTCVDGFAQTGIHAVDFRNFTFEPYCAGEESDKITVVNGEYSKETQMDGWIDRIYFSLLKTVYGDLNSDGKDEAVILTVCNTGGTGNFTEGFIYSYKAGKPSLIARIPGGDRAYGGLHDAGIAGGILTVNSYDVGEMGGACCPEFTVATKYKLTAGKLSILDKPARSPLYPTERVTFARGATGKTMQISIPAGELKRFIVRAGRGQTISVSTNSETASLRLLEDAVITKNVNGFSAKLPKAGDYTIEIENTDSKELRTALNIKIN